MGLVIVALIVAFVLVPRLWRYAVADVLAAYRARAASPVRRATLRERLRRSGPWVWREGAPL